MSQLPLKYLHYSGLSRGKDEISLHMQSTNDNLWKNLTVHCHCQQEFRNTPSIQEHSESNQYIKLEWQKFENMNNIFSPARHSSYENTILKVSNIYQFLMLFWENFISQIAFQEAFI